MGTRVVTYEVKINAFKMQLVPIKQILLELNIRQKTQVETWMR